MTVPESPADNTERTDTNPEIGIIDAARITGVTVTRKYRRIIENPTLLLLFLVPIVVLIPAIVGRVPGYEFLWSEPGAYAYGELLNRGEYDEVVPTARGVSGIVVLTAAYLVILPEINGNGHFGERIEGLLLATTPRTVALAGTLNHFLFAGRILGALGVVAVMAFSAGAIAPALLVSGVGALALAVVTGVAVAYPLVLAMKLVFLRVGLFRRNRALIGGPALLMMFALLFWFREALSTLAKTPLGWYADLALLPGAATVSISRAALVVSIVPLVVALSVIITERIGNAVWRGDSPPTPEQSASRGGPVTAALRIMFSRPTAAVAHVIWKRTRRNPGVLIFSGLLAIVTVTTVIGVATTEPDALPIIVAVYTAATLGVGVTLNPLGNEGRALTALMTIPRGPRTLVGGYVLSGSLPGLLLGGTATGTAAAWIGHTPVAVLVLGGVGAIIGGSAPATAVGLGVIFPNVEGATLTRAAGTYPPRLVVILPFVATVVALGIPALIAATATESVAATVSLSRRVVLTGGYLVTCVGVVATGVVVVRFSLSRLRRLDLAELREA